MSTETNGSDAGALRPWHLFLVVGLAASMAAVTLADDTRPTNLVMLSLTAFAAVLVGAAFHRTLQPFGTTESSVESLVLSARARAAVEREKMLVLRSIKELEFDRAMGKVADADFAEMVGRLRARAISLMTKLEAESAGYRGLVQRDLEARLAQAGIASGAAAPAEPDRKAPPPPAPRVLACSACGTSNDHDARFCKSCGAKLDAYAVSM